MASLLTGTTIAANIALHAGNVATYALPIGGGTLTSTLSITGGDGLRVFRNGAASVSSQIYWANSANTIAYNWQIDENGNAGMWGYGGVGWAKVLTVTSGGAITATGFTGSLTGTASGNLTSASSLSSSSIFILLCGSSSKNCFSKNGKIEVK